MFVRAKALAPAFSCTKQGEYFCKSLPFPAQAVYLSGGPGKTYEIGTRQLIFKKRALKESGFKHRESELVVQALKALGRDRIDSELRRKLSDALPAATWKKMVRDTKTAPA